MSFGSKRGNEVEGAPIRTAARYPLEFFSAQLAFAGKVSLCTGASLLDSILNYTDVRGELTGANYQAEPNDELWEIIVRCLPENSLDALARRVYSLYQEQPYAGFDPSWVPKGTTRFGALGVDTSPYNLDRNQVKLHFLPTRKGGSDLASSKLSARQQEMKRLLDFVKANYPEVQNFTSYSWLQNLPTYRALFPHPFLARLTVMRDKFLGLWGQFVRWDGTANQATYEQFSSRLQTVATLDEAIDAFPLKVLGAVGPLQEFYDLYAIN